MLKHVAAEYIEAFDCNGVPHYKPKAVIEWMIEHIPVNPPKALIDILSIEGQDGSNKAQEAQEASEAQIKASIKEAGQGKPLKAEIDKLYEDAMPLYHSYIKEHGTEPTKETIAKLLKENQNLEWKESSIKREMSSKELKLKYQSYKTSLSEEAA